jgi:hypothetical protein
MGLDVSWYRRVKLEPDAELDEDGSPVDWLNLVRVDEPVSFPERCADIAPGIYSSADHGSFRAGSYSGYNQWREELAELAGYPALVIAGGGKEHSHGAWQADSGPFFELINFSDCEGVIGTAVSAKLAKDFADNQTKADEVGGYFAEQYARWRNAFEQAAQGGFVDFH